MQDITVESRVAFARRDGQLVTLISTPMVTFANGTQLVPGSLSAVSGAPEAV